MRVFCGEISSSRYAPTWLLAWGVCVWVTGGATVGRRGSYGSSCRIVHRRGGGGTCRDTAVLVSRGKKVWVCAVHSDVESNLSLRYVELSAVRRAIFLCIYCALPRPPPSPRSRRALQRHGCRLHAACRRQGRSRFSSRLCYVRRRARLHSYRPMPWVVSPMPPTWSASRSVRIP